MKKQILHTFSESLLLPTKDFLGIQPVDRTIRLVRSDDGIQFETDLPNYVRDKYDLLFPDELCEKCCRSTVFEIIKEQIFNISHKVIAHCTFKDEIGEHVIFIEYSGSVKDERSGHYGSDMGKKSAMRFQFFDGYRLIKNSTEGLGDQVKTIIVEKYSAYYKPSKYDGPSAEWRRKELKPLHHTKQDIVDLKNKFIIIPYTEERFTYLVQLQSKFEELIEKVNSYLDDLTEEKLDVLMSMSPLKLLTGPGEFKKSL